MAESLLSLNRTMPWICKVEESLIKLFFDSEVPGLIHLGLGQEAVAAGVMAALDRRGSVRIFVFEAGKTYPRSCAAVGNARPPKAVGALST